ncbi:MAG: hypothetical protein AMJ62_10330 [Myxococcales bacterium SG8_38]|nr:MAG: hypothetical protein AMJ62_10330 [Myxococcales bacterium SG8_38]
MSPHPLCFVLLLGAVTACGEANGGLMGTGGTGGAGGDGGDPLSKQTDYLLSCTIDTLLLELPIELVYALDRPYVAGASSELTFSAAVTFSEDSAVAFVDAGFRNVDIISLEVATSVEGATPDVLQASLASAPINDFDLEADTDRNGRPGPHRLELEPITTTSSAEQGADQVELRLTMDQISLVLGDFEVPVECLAPTLVGFSVRFAVTPAP